MFYIHWTKKDRMLHTTVCVYVCTHVCRGQRCWLSPFTLFEIGPLFYCLLLCTPGCLALRLPGILLSVFPISPWKFWDDRHRLLCSYLHEAWQGLFICCGPLVVMSQLTSSPPQCTGNYVAPNASTSQLDGSGQHWRSASNFCLGRQPEQF